MAPVKFQFTTAFDNDAERRRAEEERRRREELEAARAQGFAEGRAQGREEMRHALEAQMAAALDRLAATAERLFADRTGLQALLEKEAALVAHRLASVLAKSLIARFPLAEIEALLAEAMAAARREPRLVARVPEALVESLEQRLEKLRLENGFLGDVVLLGDETLGPADCRIEWPDGGAERNLAALEAEIAEIVARHLDEQEALAAGDGMSD